MGISPQIQIIKLPGSKMFGICGIPDEIAEIRYDLLACLIFACAKARPLHYLLE
jgi:hypothetical protein